MRKVISKILIVLMLTSNAYADFSITEMVDAKVEQSMSAPIPAPIPVVPVGAIFKLMLKTVKKAGKELPYDEIAKILKVSLKEAKELTHNKAVGSALIQDARNLKIKGLEKISLDELGERGMGLANRLGDVDDIIKTTRNAKNFCLLVQDGYNHKANKILDNLKEGETITLDELTIKVRKEIIAEHQAKKLKIDFDNKLIKDSENLAKDFKSFKQSYEAALVYKGLHPNQNKKPDMKYIEIANFKEPINMTFSKESDEFLYYKKRADELVTKAKLILVKDPDNKVAQDILEYTKFSKSNKSPYVVMYKMADESLHSDHKKLAEFFISEIESHAYKKNGQGKTFYQELFAIDPNKTKVKDIDISNSKIMQLMLYEYKEERDLFIQLMEEEGYKSVKVINNLQNISQNELKSLDYLTIQLDFEVIDIDLLKKIKADIPDLPIIVSSRDPLSDDALKGLHNIGVDGYLYKTNRDDIPDVFEKSIIRIFEHNKEQANNMRAIENYDEFNSGLGTAPKVTPGRSDKPNSGNTAFLSDGMDAFVAKNNESNSDILPVAIFPIKKAWANSLTGGKPILSKKNINIKKPKNFVHGVFNINSTHIRNFKSEFDKGISSIKTNMFYYEKGYEWKYSKDEYNRTLSKKFEEINNLVVRAKKSWLGFHKHVKQAKKTLKDMKFEREKEVYKNSMGIEITKNGKVTKEISEVPDLVHFFPDVRKVKELNSFDLTNKSVLIISDDEDNKLIQEILEGLGAEVKLVETYDEVIKIKKEVKNYDLLFLDNALDIGDKSNAVRIMTKEFAGYNKNTIMVCSDMIEGSKTISPMFQSMDSKATTRLEVADVNIHLYTMGYRGGMNNERIKFLPQYLTYWNQNGVLKFDNHNMINGNSVKNNVSQSKVVKKIEPEVVDNSFKAEDMFVTRKTRPPIRKKSIPQVFYDKKDKTFLHKSIILENHDGNSSEQQLKNLLTNGYEVDKLLVGRQRPELLGFTNGSSIRTVQRQTTNKDEICFTNGVKNAISYATARLNSKDALIVLSKLDNSKLKLKKTSYYRLIWSTTENVPAEYLEHYVFDPKLEKFVKVSLDSQGNIIFHN